MQLLMKVASLVKPLGSLRIETLALSWALTRYCCGLVFLSPKSQIAPKSTAIANTSGGLRLSSTVKSRHGAYSIPNPGIKNCRVCMTLVLTPLLPGQITKA
jgi:hypothetical protein